MITLKSLMFLAFKDFVVCRECGIYNETAGRNVFKRGVEWLFGHLCELSEREFDEESIVSEYDSWKDRPQTFSKNSKYDGWYNYAMPVGCGFIEGARYQKSLDMAALLKAKDQTKEWFNSAQFNIEQVKKSQAIIDAQYKELEAAKQEIADLRADQKIRDDLVMAHGSRIAELEQEISRLKDDTPAYCAYCSFELPKGGKVSDLHKHTKVCGFHPLAKSIARVKELEAALSAIVDSRKNGINPTAVRRIAREALKGSGSGE